MSSRKEWVCRRGRGVRRRGTIGDGAGESGSQEGGENDGLKIQFEISSIIIPPEASQVVAEGDGLRVRNNSGL